MFFTQTPTKKKSSTIFLLLSFDNLPKSESDSTYFFAYAFISEKEDEFKKIACFKTTAETKIIINYCFHSKQTIRIEIYQQNISISEKPIYIGQAFTNLSDILLHHGETMYGQILDPTNKTVVGENKTSSLILFKIKKEYGNNDTVLLQLKGTNFKKGTFNINPLFEVHRYIYDKKFELVYKSQVKKKTTNPLWNPFSVPISKICGNDYNRKIQFKLYDNITGKLIGAFYTTLNEILSSKRDYIIYRLDKKNNKKKTGIVSIVKNKIHRKFTFLNYVLDGLNINMITAIDFSSTNIKNGMGETLHTINKNNEFIYTMKRLGDILCQYNKIGKFTIFGFGGNMSGGKEYCFPIGIDSSDVNGLNEIIISYTETASNFKMSGPNALYKVINKGIEMVKKNRMTYHVLLIITYGNSNDNKKFIEAVSNSKKLPMSIIIIKVGPDKFKKIDYNKKKIRENVIIINFRKLLSEKINKRDYLRKKSLEDIPSQILQYMKMKKLKPEEFMSKDDESNLKISLNVPLQKDDKLNQLYPENLYEKSEVSSLHSSPRSYSIAESEISKIESDEEDESNFNEFMHKPLKYTPNSECIISSDKSSRLPAENPNA